MIVLIGMDTYYNLHERQRNKSMHISINRGGCFCKTKKERDAYFYRTTKTAKSTFLECTHAEIYKKRFNWTEDGTVAS